MNIIKCFIASPSDTQLERSCCDEVFAKINRDLGDLLELRLESKKWETDVHPGFGSDSQEVIDNQIGEDFQLFIGIMWQRFGTPTSKYGSGTEQEFENAFKRHSNNELLGLMLYFNRKAPENIDDIDIESLQKVRQFKNNVSNLGGLYCAYDGPTDFQKQLESHLRNLLIRHSKNLSTAVVRTEVRSPKIEDATKLKIEAIYSQNLEDALNIFSSQPRIWVDPILSTTNEISQNADDNYSARIEISDLIEDTSSMFIKAPPQFGLTCLGRFLLKEAWSSKSALWILIETSKVKPHTVENCIAGEANKLGFSKDDIRCIVLDAWNVYEPKSLKLIKSICDSFPNTRLIVLNTIDDSNFQNEPEKIEIQREFAILHLLSLPRTQIRKLIASYNAEKAIGDEDVVLNKVISDLGLLNIHRTPFNCLTLLKVAEKYFDESPVNRTKMLEMVLFVLFDIGEIPSYKTKPDVKDCEYVLGRFCEILMRRQKYDFTREEFVRCLKSFCSEKLFELDIEIVFDILFKNHIIVPLGSSYIFRSSYWIFYFSAKEMHSNSEFAEYIFANKIYVSCPEIIEFYTGIDRKRGDALRLLINDIKETSSIVESKVKLRDDMNPFKHIKWNPTEESIKEIQNEISEDVMNSGLPDVVKDQYADRNYNQIRPYRQNIEIILKEYSLRILQQKIKACSNALRNSDYVDPEIKREALAEILRAAEQQSKVLVALAPILAANGHAAFEGAGYVLDRAYDRVKDLAQKTQEILFANPDNVVNYFKDDLFSNKIGPLLYDALKKEKSSLKKHFLALLISTERPKDWKNAIEQHMLLLNQNSFYLYDLVGTLRTQYRFGFASPEQLREISYLIRLGLAKHIFKVEKPSISNIKAIPSSNIPKREFGDEDEIEQRSA